LLRAGQIGGATLTVRWQRKARDLHMTADRAEGVRGYGT
jgi:hypothetical protein